MEIQGTIIREISDCVETDITFTIEPEPTHDAEYEIVAVCEGYPDSWPMNGGDTTKHTIYGVEYSITADYSEYDIEFDSDLVTDISTLRVEDLEVVEVVEAEESVGAA